MHVYYSLLIQLMLRYINKISSVQISAARDQAAANWLHIAAACWLSIDGTDRQMD